MIMLFWGFFYAVRVVEMLLENPLLPARGKSAFSFILLFFLKKIY